CNCTPSEKTSNSTSVTPSATPEGSEGTPNVATTDPDPAEPGSSTAPENRTTTAATPVLVLPTPRRRPRQGTTPRQGAKHQRTRASRSTHRHRAGLAHVRAVTKLPRAVVTPTVCGAILCQGARPRPGQRCR